MPALDPDEQRARVAVARVARLATLRADGTARLVPITFVLLDGLVCSAVDEVKPKRSTRLARLADVRRDPRAAVLVDHYAEDWTRLWWVRIDGTAAVHETGELADQGAGGAGREVPALRDGAARAAPVLVLTPTGGQGWRGSAPPASVTGSVASRCGACAQSSTSSSTGPEAPSRTASTCSTVPYGSAVPCTASTGAVMPGSSGRRSHARKASDSHTSFQLWNVTPASRW